MPDTFDPYYKWLGIPPREQQPHHYRLLGVAAFEDDGDVIQNAADRQMAHLRTFQSGAQSAHSQRLLNEIASARVCLLDPRRKAAYDESLRGRLPPAGAPPTAVPIGLAVAPRQAAPADAESAAAEDDDGVGAEEFADLSAARPRIAGQLRRRQRSHTNVLVVGGILGFMILGVVLVLVFGRGGEDAQDSNPSESATRASTSDSSPPVAQAPAAERVPTDTAAVERRATPRPKTRERSTPPAATTTETGTASAAVDLLAAIDPDRDAVHGRWRRSGGAIYSPADTEYARLAAATEAPASYTVQVQVERLPGNVGTRSLVLGLVADGRQFALVIDHDSSMSGLHAVDDLPFGDDNPTVRHGPRLKAAARATILCTVRPGRVLALIDGQTIVDWKGQPDQLSLASVWETPNPRLFLGANGPFRFTRWELTPPAGGSDLVSSPVVGNPSTERPPVARSQPRTGTLADLLRPTTKAAEPTSAALRTAESAIREKFEGDFSRAKTPAEQIALARKLADAAPGAAAGSAEQYALFALSAEIAADAGQFSQANDSLNELHKRFQTDVLSLKDAALAVAAGPRYVKAPSDHRAVAESWVLLVNEAIAQDQYAAAERFARRAVASARQSTDKIFLTMVVEGNKKVEQAADAYARARIAREALETNADDPVAGSVWGRFCCLVKNDWEQGLPFWAGAGQDELSSLAARDLTQPKTASDRAALADAWWDAAEREPQSLAKRMLQLRAVHWYQLALPQLTGLAKTQAVQRIDAADLTRSVIPLDEWVDVLGMVDPARHTAAGEWGRRGTEIGAIRRARFARFMLPVAPEGSYDLEVRVPIAPGGGAEVDVVLPVGERACTLVLGGWSGAASGLHTIDNAAARDNATAVKPSRIAVNESYKLDIHVDVTGDEAAIQVEIDGRDYLAWQGKRASLNVTREYALSKPGALALGAYETSAVFHSARLRLRSGAARVLLD